MENLEPLANEAKAAIAAAEDGATLEQLRVDYLGKKGQITALLKGLGKLSAEERPAAGAKINVVKQELQGLIGARKTALESVAVEARLAEEAIDVTLPGRGQQRGGLAAPYLRQRPARGRVRPGPGQARGTEGTPLRDD